jgi:small subunit ribosomal protein S15
MYLNKEKKAEIFENHSFTKSVTDTGSPESQVALLTHRISHLTEHLRHNKKDKSTQLGLIKMVGSRKKLLRYLQEKDINRYRAIIKELGLRK